MKQFLTLLILSFRFSSFSQVWQPITHLSGMQNIAGVNVSVKSALFANAQVGGGYVCYPNTISAQPYSNSSSPSDTVTYTFIQPVSTIRIFAGSLDYAAMPTPIGEEMVVYVNGNHYNLSQATVFSDTCTAVRCLAGVNSAGNLQCLTPTYLGAYNWRGSGVVTITLPAIDSVAIAQGAENSGIGWGISFVSCPSANLNATALDDTLCAGQVLSLQADSIANMTYSWSGPNGFTAASRNATLNNVTALATGNYIVTAIVDTYCYYRDTVAIQVYNNPATPTISYNGTCTGSTLSLSAVATAGASYTWTGPNGFTANTQSPSISNVTTAASGTYTVTAMANGCTSSATASINITTTATPSIAISASPSASICAGTSVTLTALASNGGSAPVYQWKLNGNNISGANSSTYITSGISNGDVYTCELVSNLSCASPATASSNSISFAVQPMVTPTVTVTSTEVVTCTGKIVTFTATTTNGGTNPTYQWKRNGQNVGANSNVYIDSTLTNQSTVYCVLTSNAACITTPVVNSNILTITVNTIIEPIITRSGDTLKVTPPYFVNYQWYLNNAPIPGATNSTYFMTQNGMYQVQATDSMGCKRTSAIAWIQNVSVNQQDLERNIRVYPNPAKDYINIEAQRPVNLALYTIQGQLVVRKEQANSLDIAALPAGIYLLTIADEKGQVMKKERVVKW